MEKRWGKSGGTNKCIVDDGEYSEPAIRAVFRRCWERFLKYDELRSQGISISWSPGVPTSALRYQFKNGRRYIRSTAYRHDSAPSEHRDVATLQYKNWK